MDNVIEHTLGTPADDAQPVGDAAQNQSVEAAKIAGYPVWKLEGVNEDNVDAIKDTGLWVHYTKFGMDGWGIVTRDEARQAVMVDLASHGITATPWEELPYRTSARLILLLGLTFALVMVAVQQPIIGGMMMVGTFVLNAIIYKSEGQIERGQFVEDTSKKPILKRANETE